MKPAGFAVAWTRRPAKPGRGADAAATSRHQATHRGAGFVVARQRLPSHWLCINILLHPREPGFEKPLLDELVTDAAGVGDEFTRTAKFRLEALRYAADGVVVANVPFAAQSREDLVERKAPAALRGEKPKK